MATELHLLQIILVYMSNKLKLNHELFICLVFLFFINPLIWFSEVSATLQCFGFSRDRLPTPLGRPSRSPKDSLTLIQDTIYRAFIQAVWVSPPQPLTPKLAHYHQHFLCIVSGMILPRVNQPSPTPRLADISRLVLGLLPSAAD